MINIIKRNGELFIIGIILVGAFILLANRVDNLNKSNLLNNNIAYNISN